MNNIEKSHFPKSEYSFLNEEDFKEFVEFRKINYEYIEILKKLSQFPKKFFIEFHNFFQLSHNQSLHLLDAQRKNLSPEKITPEQREFSSKVGLKIAEPHMDKKIMVGFERLSR